MKAVREGQALRHEQYGIGVAKSSDEARTVIDFYEHGQKTFVTGLLDAQLLDEAPPRPSKAKAKAKGKAPRKKKSDDADA